MYAHALRRFAPRSALAALLGLAALAAACAGAVDPVSDSGPRPGDGLISFLDAAGDGSPPSPGDAARADAPAPPPPAAPLPIGFWCGPPAAFVSEERYREVREAGYNFLMPPCEGSSTVELNRKILDTAQAVGLKAFLADARMPLAISGAADAAQRLDAIVADYAAHPALAGYYVTDEPGAGAFAGLAEVVAHLRRADPAHPAYINLLPNYAPPEMLGTPTYAEHVSRFIAEVRPAIVSYDHYHFLGSGDRPGFFSNLAVVRELALQHDLPFWQIVLLVPHIVYRSPSEAELSWEALHTLAYGGRGVMHFTYWTPPDPAFGAGVIDRDGSRSAHFEHARRVNAATQAIGTALADARSAGVFHSGAITPDGVLRPPHAPVYVIGGDITVGLFGGGGFSYALLVNRRYDAEQAFTAQIASGGVPVERLDQASGAWSAAGSPGGDGLLTLQLRLAAGAGELLRAAGPGAAGPPGPEVLIGIVRADAGTLYLVDSQHGTTRVAPGGWNSCSAGFTLVGTALHSNGFWLCARDDLASRTFHVGNVVADVGYYYAVSAGTVSELPLAGWDSCPAGSSLLGRSFESNGFWICMQ